MDNSLWFQRLLLGVVAIGLVMMVGGGVWLNQALSFEDRATPLQGVVVDLVPDREGEVYYPHIRHPGPFGEPVILRGRVGTYPPAYEIGERVDLLVDPDDPADVRIKGGFALWGGPLILAGLGLLMIVPSLVVLLVLRASARRRAAGG